MMGHTRPPRRNQGPARAPRSSASDRPGRRRRWVIRAGLVLVGLALLGGTTLWLLVYHRPGWYEPVYVPQAQRAEVRRDAVRTYNDFGDALVRGRPFDFVLDEQQVGRWIAARASIWPESEAWLPPWVREPAVKFEDGQVMVGARINWHGQEAVAGCGVQIALTSPDMLCIRLERATLGSLPLPVRSVATRLFGGLRMESLDLDLVPAPVAEVVEYFRERDTAADLLQGIRRANRFIWANGRRPFRIAAIQSEGGKLMLRIEPL